MRAAYTPGENISQQVHNLQRVQRVVGKALVDAEAQRLRGRERLQLRQ